jgi:hypothetical protein
MIREVVLVKALEARLQSGDIRLPMSDQTALTVIRLIVPHFIEIMKQEFRQELAEARRDWEKRSRQL